MTRLESSLYEAQTFLNSIAPCKGQFSGTLSFSSGRFSFAVELAKLMILAIAPSEVSSCVQFLIMDARDWLNPITFSNAKPTKPGLISALCNHHVS